MPAKPPAASAIPAWRKDPGAEPPSRQPPAAVTGPQRPSGAGQCAARAEVPIPSKERSTPPHVIGEPVALYRPLTTQSNGDEGTPGPSAGPAPPRNAASCIDRAGSSRPRQPRRWTGLMPGRTDDRGLFAAGDSRKASCWEGWWSRSGSNRRPPECHSELYALKRSLTLIKSLVFRAFKADTF